MAFPYVSLCCTERRGAKVDSVIMAATTDGSASLIAKVGSALLCRRFASFSACVSCKSLLPELLCDR